MDRAELVRNLKELVELDKGFGVEFTLREQKAESGERKAESAPEARSRRPEPRSEKPEAKIPLPASNVPPPASRAPHIDPTWLALPAPEALTKINESISACTRCVLRSGCKQTVPGEGSSAPDLMFIGEGPGADEDAQGRPFVGAAGQLLDKMIGAMGFKREDVYIANIVKCRPPGNRTPLPEEVTACMPFLRAQIATLKPKVICTLGNTPLRALLGDENLGITRLHGSTQRYQDTILIPTFHPSYLLRNPAAKKPCWEDLQIVLQALGKSAPRRG